MRLTLPSIMLSAMFLLSVQASAQVRTPLPAKILQAKTVFVDNQSGLDRARDEFVDELGKWQRLRIVYNKWDADLVATLTTQRTQQPLGGTTQLALVDDKTGENVWANSMEWSELGAMRDLMRDLKQRIDEQEANPQR